MNVDPNFANLTLSVLALVSGLILLVVGGESLVAGASKFALRHGMRPMVVGLTIVAFGTSTPELFVSLNAALHDHVDIMIGNVVGSNIANIGLVLALAALLRVVPVKFASISKELYLVLTVSVLVFVIAWSGYFHRAFGLLFVVGLLCYTINACWKKRNLPSGDGVVVDLVVYESHLKIIGLQLGGLVLLAYGSGLFIDGAVDVARYLKVSELVVGLTVAAVGTSLPELSVSVVASARGKHETAIGNVIGSNIFNILLIIGAICLIRPIFITQATIRFEIPLMVAYSILLLPLLRTGFKLSRLEGFILLLSYAVYIWILFVR
ncbi:MAG: calcium/sodium antiporter [Desulfobulbaceae bacterium]|nr:calcium/sodium antiporter [Desulfobulbaceae bacterium]